MIGIYFHIPFCKQACSYCDFYFVTRTIFLDSFVDALIKEIRHWSETPLFKDGADTLYFGGGTPSQMRPEHWERIFEALQTFITARTKEITVEVNPDDVTTAYLQTLKNLGVNRLSIGIQSFDEKRLRFMNRAHSVEQAKFALNCIKEVGFKTFTADLIYGNPNQSLQDLESDLNEMLSFDIPHISAYSLTVEPRTRLGKAVKLGKVIPLEDDFVREHFFLVRNTLEKNGYEAYEVSNFARNGHRSIHNSHYWSHVNYIGMGPAAHSFLWNENGVAERWSHAKDIKHYVDKPYEQFEHQQLTNEELVEERLLISLRIKDGISLDELRNRYQFQFNEKQKTYIQWLISEKLMKKEDETLHFTEEGIVLADHLILEILSKEA